MTAPCVVPLFRKFAPPSGAPVVVPALTVARSSDEPASGIPPFPGAADLPIRIRLIGGRL